MAQELNALHQEKDPNDPNGAMYPDGTIYDLDLSQPSQEEGEANQISPDYEGMILVRPNFKNAKITGANFKNCRFVNAHFEDVSWSGEVIFEGSKFEGVTYSTLNDGIACFNGVGYEPYSVVVARREVVQAEAAMRAIRVSGEAPLPQLVDKFESAKSEFFRVRALSRGGADILDDEGIDRDVTRGQEMKSLHEKLINLRTGHSLMNSLKSMESEAIKEVELSIATVKNKLERLQDITLSRVRTIKAQDLKGKGKGKQSGLVATLERDLKVVMEQETESVSHTNPCISCLVWVFRCIFSLAKAPIMLAFKAARSAIGAQEDKFDSLQAAWGLIQKGPDEPWVDVELDTYKIICKVPTLWLLYGIFIFGDAWEIRGTTITAFGKMSQHLADFEDLLDVEQTLLDQNMSKDAMTRGNPVLLRVLEIILHPHIPDDGGIKGWETPVKCLQTLSSLEHCLKAHGAPKSLLTATEHISRMLRHPAYQSMRDRLDDELKYIDKLLIVHEKAESALSSLFLSFLDFAFNDGDELLYAIVHPSSLYEQLLEIDLTGPDALINEELSISTIQLSDAGATFNLNIPTDHAAAFSAVA
eukprot:UC4_evm10s293